MKKLLFTGFLSVFASLSALAQDRWLEFLDFQLRGEAGLHGLFLPSRQNSFTLNGNRFADTSLLNPGIHLKLVAAPLAHRNFGISGFWERQQGYAVTSDHQIQSRGFEAYLGTAKLQVVYGWQELSRQAYLNHSSYISSSTVEQWIGGSVYDDIRRNQFGLRIKPRGEQRLDIGMFNEFWPTRNLSYRGYALSFLGSDGWQVAAEVIPAHPVIGFNLLGTTIPSDIKSESLMCQLKITRHFVYSGNYRKLWKYGP